MPKTTKLESQIYTHALKANDQTFSNDDLTDKLFKEKSVEEKLEAINKLLKKNLLQIVTLSTGGSGYKAVSKESAKKYKEMDSDEQLAYQYIDASGNEGIWTKTLKMRTNLHQTVINRVIKSLEGRGSIKAVKSVKHPTRKIYMISSLNPSVELTGGPWYTDNELDTEFVDQLKLAVLGKIRSETYPKIKGNNKPIYAASKARLPNVTKLHKWVMSSGLTHTELETVHIQNLVDVLMFDGEIERLPAVSGGAVSEDEEYSDSGSSDSDHRSKKRRKHSKSKSSKKSKKRGSSSEESGSSSGSDSEDDSRRKKSKSRSRSRSKSTKRNDSDESDQSDDDDDDKPRKKSKKSKSIKMNSDGESGSASESEEENTKKRKRSSKSKKKKSKKSKKYESSDEESLVDVSDSDDEQKVEMKQADPYANSVYRAVKNADSDDVGPVVGWTEAPCGRCPVFEFCAQDGPVNASKCQYFDKWLQGEAEDEE